MMEERRPGRGKSPAGVRHSLACIVAESRTKNRDQRSEYSKIVQERKNCTNYRKMRQKFRQNNQSLGAVPPFFSEFSGRLTGQGAEDPGEVVVVIDPHRLRHGGDGKAVLEQQGLGRVDAPPGDEVGERLAAGELLGQAAQLGPSPPWPGSSP